MMRFNLFISFAFMVFSVQRVVAGGGVVDGGGLGDMTRYVSCINTHYHFTITGTAVPTFFSGQVFSLETDDSVAQFGCQRVDGSPKIFWTCISYDDNEVKISVERKNESDVQAIWFSNKESEPLILDTFTCELKERN